MVSPTHWSSIGETLYSYWENDFMCDTILVACDGQLKAHGIVLAAISPLCKTAFESSETQGRCSLEFPDTDVHTLKIMLQYAYTGKLVVPFKESQAEELLKSLASLQQYGIDIQKLNRSEIKFKGDSDANEPGVAEAAMGTSDQESMETSGSDDPKAELKQEKFFISVSKDTGAVDVASMLGNFIANSNAAKETEGHQEIVLEYDSSIDPQQCEMIKNLSENGVISEHSYPSFELVNQKSSEFENIVIKLENAECEENDDSMETSETDGEGQDSGLSCPYCDTIFYEGAQLEDHVATIHAEVTNFACETCELKFPSAYKLSKHTGKHTRCKQFQCHMCGEAFAQKRLLREHMISHDEGPACFICGMCNIVIYSRENLYAHMWAEHQMNKKEVDESESQETHLGNIGEFEVGTPQVDSESRPYLCDVCGNGFKTSWTLKNHEKIHAENNPSKVYRCDECSLTFAHKSQYLQHMVKHNGSKPHTCGICQKSYSQKGSLTQHMRTHSGERPYTCNDCGKAFVIKAMLMQHIRVHTGEKPHQCEYCNKRFVYKESLVVHVRIHTGEKPYKCRVCDKSYTQSHHLKGHLLVHTGEKPFRCLHCEKAYKNRVDLRFHCQRVHQIDISRRPTKVKNERSDTSHE